METREAIFGRRSIRSYLDKPIEKEMLQDIIDGALMAPSGVNTQPWYFVAIHSEEGMEKLRGIYKEISEKSRQFLEVRFPTNPEVISETVGFLKSLGNAKACVLAFLLKPGAENNINNIESIGAALQNLCLMAYDKGLGSCWMTAPLEAGYGDVMSSEFAPEAGKFIAAVSLGYTAINPTAPKRKQGRYKII